MTSQQRREAGDDPPDAHARSGTRLSSSHEPNWILRQIAEHVADAWYAEQVGTLSGGISKHPDRRSVAIDGAVAASHVASPGGVAVRAPVRAAAAAMLAAWSAMAGLSGSPATNSR